MPFPAVIDILEAHKSFIHSYLVSTLSWSGSRWICSPQYAGTLGVRWEYMLDGTPDHHRTPHTHLLILGAIYCSQSTN